MPEDLSSVVTLDGIEDRLKAVRAASDMSPQAFADSIDVKSRQTMLLYEKPNHPPPADYLLAFCCKTNSHPVWILTGLGSRYWNLEEQVRTDMSVISTYLTDEAIAVAEKVAGMDARQRVATEMEPPPAIERTPETTERKRA